MPAAYVAVRPSLSRHDLGAGSFLVCEEHGLRLAFGDDYPVAKAACVEHNALHHPDLAARRHRLLSIVYRSRAADGVAEAEVAEVLERAQRRNRAVGVTGMLIAEDGWFLQALEGPAAIVGNLMRSIEADPRHTDVQVLTQEVLPERRFPDFAMARGQVGEIATLPLAEYYEALLIARARASARRR